jgi:hypothetical protein
VQGNCTDAAPPVTGAQLRQLRPQQCVFFAGSNGVFIVNSTDVQVFLFSTPTAQLWICGVLASHHKVVFVVLC